MKFALLAVCAAAGYGLYSIDYIGLFGWFKSLSVDERGALLCCSYIAIGWLTYAALTVCTERTNEDFWKIAVGILWLPAFVLCSVFFPLSFLDKGLRKLGDKINERK